MFTQIIKKFNLYLLGIMLVVGFTSCKNCKDCESTITTTRQETGLDDSVGTITKNEGEQCDDDLNKSNGKSITTKSTNGKATYTTTKKTSCY